MREFPRVRGPVHCARRGSPRRRPDRGQLRQRCDLHVWSIRHRISIAGAAFNLQFQAMQWGRELGAAQYDLWGIPDQDPSETTSIATMFPLPEAKTGEVSTGSRPVLVARSSGIHRRCQRIYYPSLGQTRGTRHGAMAMTRILSDLASTVADASLVGDGSIEISDIQYDSRQVTPGCLFAALRGGYVDGHDFIRNAIEGGAEASTYPSRAGIRHSVDSRPRHAIRTLTRRVQIFRSPIRPTRRDRNYRHRRQNHHQLFGRFDPWARG